MVSPVEFDKLAHGIPGAKLKTFWQFLIFSAGSVLFTGGIIAILSNLLRGHTERHRAGLTHYKQNGHYLIMGYNDLTMGLITHLFNKHGNAIDIVLQTSQPVQPLREKIEVQLTKKQRRKLFFVYTRRDTVEELRPLHIDKAKEIYLMGEKHEPNHDVINLNALMNIAEMMKSKGREKKVCHLYLENQSTFYLFQTNEISTVKLVAGDTKVGEYLIIYPFNANVNWARTVFVKGEAMKGVKYEPLDFKGIGSNSTQYVHLVVVGMTPMGVAMALEAAHVAHYPNFIKSEKHPRTRITMIDLNAKEEMQYLTSKYDHYFDCSHYRLRCFNVVECENEDTQRMTHLPDPDFLDVEWEFIQANFADMGIQNEIGRWAEDKDQLLTIAFCADDIAKNVAMGYYLPDNCYDNDHVSVLVRQNFTGEVMESLYKTDGSRYKNVRPFGMLDEGFEDDAELIEMAKRVNAVYNVGLKGNVGEYAKVESDWEGLKVSDKWSNMYNAMTIPTKLRSLECDRKQIADAAEWLPVVEHNRWNVEKMLLGFRPTTKEEDKKIKGFQQKHDKNVPVTKDDIDSKEYYKDQIRAHYDIRPYEDLLPDDKGNDPQDSDIVLSKNIKYIIEKTEKYGQKDNIDLLNEIVWEKDGGREVHESRLQNETELK